MTDLVALYPELAGLIESQLADITLAPPEQLGDSCEVLCTFMRAAAIAQLLMEMNTDGFYHRLIRSGMTRRFLLSRTPPQEKQESRYCKIQTS